MSKTKKSGMNRYEIMFIVPNKFTEDEAKTIISRVEKMITDAEGKIAYSEYWGKKKLAYQIKKHDSAVYVFYTLDIPGENVRKIESVLNITDEVIRFLIVRPDLKKLAKAEAEKARKAEQAAKRGESDDKEEEEEE